MIRLKAFKVILIIKPDLGMELLCVEPDIKPAGKPADFCLAFEDRIAYEINPYGGSQHGDHPALRDAVVIGVYVHSVISLSDRKGIIPVTANVFGLDEEIFPGVS
jgi:hypothetical protein